MPLQVDLVSADNHVWSGEAAMVVARTTEGDIGVLPGHEPTLAVLLGGEVRIIRELGGETVTAVIEDGFLSVEHDRVTLVTETAALASGSAAH